MILQADCMEQVMTMDGILFCQRRAFQTAARFIPAELTTVASILWVSPALKELAPESLVQQVTNLQKDKEAKTWNPLTERLSQLVRL